MTFRPKLIHIAGLLVLLLMAGTVVFIGAAGRGVYDHVSFRIGAWSPSVIEERTFSAEITAWLEEYYLGPRTLTTQDGVTLTAERFAPLEPSHKWVLIAQGVLGRSMYMGEAARHLHLLNYNVLSYALRGHGESGGGRIGLGVRDKEDILAFIREIELEDPEAEIIIFGFSAGAAAALLASPETPVSVKGIIADSAYNNLSAYLNRRWDYDLPAAPFLAAASVICRRDNGFWFGSANPARAVENTRVPLLFLHGEADQDTPLSMALQNFQNAKGVAPGIDEKTGKALKATKFLVTFPGVTHAQAIYDADDAYWIAVRDFLDAFG